MIQKVGTKLLWLMVILALATALLGLLNPWYLLAELLFVPLVLLGLWDLNQKQHSILRNFPILGHFRFIIEDILLILTRKTKASAYQTRNTGSSILSTALSLTPSRRLVIIPKDTDVACFCTCTFLRNF